MLDPAKLAPCAGKSPSLARERPPARWSERDKKRGGEFEKLRGPLQLKKYFNQICLYREVNTQH
jgi:hypothetical protein